MKNIILKKKFKNFRKLPITIEAKNLILLRKYNKPKAFPNENAFRLGNSDAMWLFPNRIPNFNYNRPNIDDFLGRGFNGDIYGKRSRMHAVKLGKNTLNLPIVSYAKPRICAISKLCERQSWLNWRRHSKKIYHRF